MDYYQGVVVEYLRAKRSRFVNTECLIQLTPGNTPERGTHWFCDAVAVDLSEPAVFLCEISYARGLASLLKRLAAWRANWAALRGALTRDCAVPEKWIVQPWLFVPDGEIKPLEKRLGAYAASPDGMPAPRITPLQDVAPWNYRSWNGMEYEDVERMKSLDAK